MNVSRFKDRCGGVGGIDNIAQNAQSLVFCGTLTTGGLEVAVRDGRLEIVREGTIRKLVSQVEQVSFSSKTARSKGQRVLYITERAVFELTRAGLELIEVAPGIDIETQVFGAMEFRPVVRQVRPMSPHCFVAPLQSSVSS